MYNVNAFRDAWKYLATLKSYNVSPISDDMMVLPFDCTTRDGFVAESGSRYLADGFNMQNGYFARLYLSYDTVNDVSEAFCSVDMDGTGNGTYINEAGSVASAMGMYSYAQDGESAFHSQTFFIDGYSIYNVLSALKSCINHSTENVWDMNNDGINNMIDVIRMLKAMTV